MCLEMHSRTSTYNTDSRGHIVRSMGICWEGGQANRGQIHSPWLGFIVNSGIGLSYWPASLCSLPGPMITLCGTAGDDFIPPVRDYEFGYSVKFYMATNCSARGRIEFLTYSCDSSIYLSYTVIIAFAYWQGVITGYTVCCFNVVIIL